MVRGEARAFLLHTMNFCSRTTQSTVVLGGDNHDDSPLEDVEAALDSAGQTIEESADAAEVALDLGAADGRNMNKYKAMGGCAVMMAGLSLTDHDDRAAGIALFGVLLVLIGADVIVPPGAKSKAE